MSADRIRRNIRMVQQTRWLEECGSNTTLKMLIRLLKDLAHRFVGLKALNVWIIHLLAHYAVMNTASRQPLPIGPAFRRALSLLSAGILLHGSAGIVDPCDATRRAHADLTMTEQDAICATAQTLMRVLYHGGYSEICGAGGNMSSEWIFCEASWDKWVNGAFLSSM